MATWKKIIVSGSNAELNQITASSGINATLLSSQQANFVSYNSASGQLGYFGTGSLTAATASYVTGSNVYGPFGSNSILSASVTSVTDTTTGVGPYYITFKDATTGFPLDRVDSTGLTYNAATNTITVTSSYANQALSASYAATASYVLQAVSASFATTASYYGGSVTSASYASSSTSASYAQTASYVQTAQTASYVLQAVSASFATTASYVKNAQTASYVLQAVSASLAATASNISPAITNNTNDYILTATGGGTINGENKLTFDGTTLTVDGNTTITGNLSVAGTASFTNTDNLNIKDKFILINSGSTTLADSGWITQYNAAGSGSAFYLEAGNAGPYGRFAVAFDAIGTSTALTPSEYVVTAKIDQASAPTTAVPPTWGTGSSGAGNMWIMNNAAGDIYIYS